jgi:DNA-binding phage protein
MAIETRPWDAAEYLDSEEMILAYLEAVFEDGDPNLITLALNNVARARGIAAEQLDAQTDISAVIRTMKALGFELTAKAA